ncbi:MAG: T9SS type A sorting domain-containing protein [Bacteroidetes bacterium]|nr:T9SS type A sorting domain-containing protein [Bacteroidota bacterium]
MKKLFLLLSGILLSFYVSAQPCLHDGRGFYTQVDVDLFHRDNPNCTVIQGDVIISGSDIKNLDSLRGLVSIEGYLDISHTELLGDLSGLDSLRAIGGHFGIYSNLNLRTLKGLGHLQLVGDNFEIFDNPVLRDLKGLDTLAAITRNFWIGSNPVLDTLKGLKNLRSIGGLLQVNDNLALKGLRELGNLKNLGQELLIYSKQSLRSLSGLDSIRPGMIPAISIYNNEVLSVCDVYSICKYFDVTWGSVTIYNNRAGCNNKAEVKAGCDTLGVQTLQAGLPFLLYPNPTSGTLSIQVLNNLQQFHLSLSDIRGREILGMVMTEPETLIDLGKLPGGIYFMRLVSGSQNFASKIIKY